MAKIKVDEVEEQDRVYVLKFTVEGTGVDKIDGKQQRLSFSKTSDKIAIERTLAQSISRQYADYTKRGIMPDDIRGMEVDFDPENPPSAPDPCRELIDKLTKRVDALEQKVR